MSASRRTTLSALARSAVLLAGIAAGVARGANAQDEDGLAVGTPAPVVAIHDLDRKTVDLGRYIGKRPVFLEFWATWCEVCAALLPHVRAMHAQFGDKVEFVGVNVSVNQTPARVRRYLAEHKPPFRTLYDDQGKSTRAYRVPTTSYVVIVDRHGRVAYTGSGADQRFDAVLRKVTAQ